MKSKFLVSPRTYSALKDEKDFYIDEVRGDPTPLEIWTQAKDGLGYLIIDGVYSGVYVLAEDLLESESKMVQ